MDAEMTFVFSGEKDLDAIVPLAINGGKSLVPAAVDFTVSTNIKLQRIILKTPIPNLVYRNPLAARLLAVDFIMHCV